MLVDVHCHLDAITHDAIEHVVHRAKENGVGIIINNGSTPETNRKTLLLAQQYPVVKPALGLHPQDIVSLPEDAVSEEVGFIRKQDEIIAIGEIGLDYHWITKPEEQRCQRACFELLLALAEKMKKPVIVHSRKAEADTLEMLQSSSLKKVVLHCFNGNMNLVKKGINAGWHFSIPANVVRDGHFQKVTGLVPLQQLLTETDAPFLGPEKDVPNEPANIIKALPVIAQLKKITTGEMEKIIFMNYQRLFC